MSQVTVYGNAASLAKHHTALSDAIHRSVMSALDYPPEKRFHRFMPMEEPYFVYPEDRGPDYTIIEISMFEGRSEIAKRDLIQELFRNIEDATGIAPLSIEITIFEAPKVNWGIRGQNGADLGLNYKVDV